MAGRQFGSIEKNLIIDAVNKRLPNPCVDTKKGRDFYKAVADERMELEQKYPDQPCHFSFVEADQYEIEELRSYLPDLTQIEQ